MTILLTSFIAAFTYSFILLGSVNPLIDNGITILFCVGTVIAFGRIAGSQQDAEIGLKQLLYIVVGLHLGILLGYLVWDPPVDRLWVPDSTSQHVPGAKAVVDLLMNQATTSGVDGDFYFTHYFVGIFFLLFGVNPVASGIALLIPKLITIVLTFKLGARAFDSRIGLIAAASYGLLPTILFYTLVFYKEAFVHCFTMGATFILFLIKRREHRKWDIALLPCLLLLIANERFYLFPLFVIATLWVVGSALVLNFAKRAAILAVLVASTVVFVAQFSNKIDFGSFFSELTRFKNEYNSYSDVDRRWNADLLYPLGVIKLYFSPYFHPRKFDLFYEYSLLLIWGSFLSQIILLFGAVQVIRQALVDGLKKFTNTFGFMFVPFVGVMLVFGYVAPFAGRIRDTFVPIVAIFFAKIYVDFTVRRKQKNHSV